MKWLDGVLFSETRPGISKIIMVCSANGKLPVTATLIQSRKIKDLLFVNAVLLETGERFGLLRSLITIMHIHFFTGFKILYTIH